MTDSDEQPQEVTLEHVQPMPHPQDVFDISKIPAMPGEDLEIGNYVNYLREHGTEDPED